MTTTAENIVKLEAALASGVLTIESEGDRKTYRSRADLLGAIDYFKRQAAAEAAPLGVRPATTLAVYDPR
ncbi:phage head-tail joining protein [Sphingomonas hengshuiensis]|uniref:Uncharacterized protein n=1 Tax=Sphingomonas hengshuiensis TaxID=1609977 RepID=A0A7U4J8M2_9SPHN|nr:hypothetical protein [Sphingomonas hengshuiensis]AJP72273.1 hypothetical protein TS85_11460 [Sphingomonas hengshuiensis]